MSTTPIDQPGSGGAVLRKGVILFILGIIQLMIILDATIVNVAIDNIRVDLEVQSTGDLQWIVTGYALAFGGFLLLGGKLADRIGRRRIFMAGALLFALASLIGGLATNLGMLIAARGLQGFGGALMAPAALSILTVVFAEGRERDRALVCGRRSPLAARPRPPSWRRADRIPVLGVGVFREHSDRIVCGCRSDCLRAGKQGRARGDV